MTQVKEDTNQTLANNCSNCKEHHVLLVSGNLAATMQLVCKCGDWVEFKATRSIQPTTAIAEDNVIPLRK